MESLLPSEIARLVLGYLEDQKCEEAARFFLEMCPHLTECRAVSASGRRFSTRVNGFTLMDILEQFCSAYLIIQERLSKVSDCEHLKHCGDLLEQLRFLIDGSRGQRFVVNINVPTTSQTSGGSPIISSSMRKRHHSGSDRDRSKRAHKSHSHTSEKSEPVTSQTTCNAVETTSLEHLPGNAVSRKTDDFAEKVVEKSHETAHCSSTAVETIGSQSLPENRRETHNVLSTSLPDFDMLRNLDVRTETVKSNIEKQESSHQMCSAATDTEELMHFTNTEVQTMPYDIGESETEMIDEPVENLSLLTKELLNRTEFRQIAEKVNEALPADVSLRDVSLPDSIDGEINTSIMTELNNAIKLAANATESDPGSAKLLDDIIGPSCKNDTGPDENVDHQSSHTNCCTDQNAELPSKEPPQEASTSDLKKPPQEAEITEVPLKNRLRSSSSQQIGRPEENRLSHKPDKKDDAALEDLNAAAIFSIINVNNKSKYQPSNINLDGLLDANIEAEKESVASSGTSSNGEIIPSMPDLQNPQQVFEIGKTDVPTSSLDAKSSKKTNTRKPRVSKQKPKVLDVVPENLMTEEEIMAMPTLIVSSKEEMTSLIGDPPKILTQPVVAGGYCASQFLPIAPKTGDVILAPPKPDPIYLRTVTVPVRQFKSLAPKIEPEIKPQPVPVSKPRPGRRQSGRATQRKPRIAKQAESAPVAQNSLCSIIEPTPVLPTEEKITLYGENSAGAVFDETEIPPVEVTEPISVSGTGLSPFLKFNSVKPMPQLEDVEMIEEKATNSSETLASATNNVLVTTQKQEPSTSKKDSYDVLINRTPRSLLKSRSKNHRLSSSTPRRRSSHIRALDFNTPTKGMNSSRRMSTNEILQFSPKTSDFVKTVCRTSLFKSPTSTGRVTPSKKIKSPMKDFKSCKIPIATRSPAPKLMGGWDKYTGVGLILGSTSSTSSSPVKPSTPSQITGKSWDADLRKSLQLAEETQQKVTKKALVKKAQNKRRTRRKTIISKSISLNEDCSSDCDWLPAVKDTDAAVNNVSVACEESKATKVGGNPIDCLENIEIVPESQSSSKETSKEVKNSNEVVETNVQPHISDSACKISKTTINTTKTIETVTNSNVILKTDKTVKKKYAQLKTITTNITKIDRSESAVEHAGIPKESTEKSLEFSQTCSIESSRQISLLPDILSLETPRKFDNTFGIPPTPRLLSPSSSVCSQAPFRMQACEDSGKLRSFVTTPEFPPTPSIAVTPKQMNENTVDASKREQYSSSYYQPSSELKDPRLPKNDQSRHDMSLPLPGMVVKTTESCVTDISIQVAQGFQAATTSNKLEITQFEVIKENLPREEAFKELKISTSAKESTETANVEDSNKIPALLSISDQDEIPETKDIDNSGSTIDDDSSDSDSSDSSSDSSSSSSSSSSNSSSGTNTSANLSLTRQYTKKPPNKKYTEAGNDSLHKTADVSDVILTAKDEASTNSQPDIHKSTDNTAIMIIQVSKVENEASPQKVFPIAKTEEDMKETIKETPAKDDSLLSEAVIFETPSSSKAGIETLTNLNTKISAMITSKDRESGKSNVTTDNKPIVNPEPRRALPKIVSVQRILPDVSIALKPSPVSETLYTAMQSRNHGTLHPSAMSNAKLSKQLEEKRLRMMAKFKESEKPPTYKPRIKRMVALPKGRKQKDESLEEKDKQDNSEHTESSKDKTVAVPQARRQSDEKNEISENEVKLNSSEIKELPKRKSSRIREIEENQEIVKKDVIEKKENAEAEAKAERIKKAQMFKELFDESLPDVPTPIKETTIEKSKVCPEIAVKDIEKKDKSVDLKNNDLKSKDKPRLSEKEKGETDSEAKVSKESARNIEKLPDTILDKNMIDSLSLGAEEEVAVQSSENAQKDKEDCVVQVSAPSPFESKIVTKSKVDLVKRDLFSDEESSDQRTTRSRTRQYSDAQRSDSADSHISIRSDPRTNRSAPPKEDLPGVLECLQLVPTVKCDATGEEVNILETSQCHAEFHYVYDDSVPTKKRKRRFSSSELEFAIQVPSTDENDQMCTKVMSATPYEEMFNLSPPRKRRGPSKDTLAKAAKTKKDVNTQKNVKSVFKDIHDKPLATSSPVIKASTTKTATKTAKSPTKKGDHHQTDTKKKTAMKTEKIQSEHEKPTTKSRKRKASTSQDSEQVEKKSRATDPQLLSKLSKVDIDEFLTTVHGPA